MLWKDEALGRTSETARHVCSLGTRLFPQLIGYYYDQKLSLSVALHLYTFALRAATFAAFCLPAVPETLFLFFERPLSCGKSLPKAIPPWHAIFRTLTCGTAKDDSVAQEHSPKAFKGAAYILLQPPRSELLLYIMVMVMVMEHNYLGLRHRLDSTWSSMYLPAFVIFISF
jgi:hypothetical protein